MTPDEVDALPPTPDAATELFGDRLGSAETFARLLATDGVTHGHIGPREVPRLWQRHLLNSALVTDLIPATAAPTIVLDVGSGAGLPGLPMAIRRPDLRLTLLEPMARRVRFLDAAVAELGLGDTVSVVRGRAGDSANRDMTPASSWVVARAVAPLERLVRWCLPLLLPEGVLLAMKGRTAAEEVERDDAVIRQVGGSVQWVKQVGGDADVEPTWVVGVRKTRSHDSRRSQRPARQRAQR